MSTDLPPSYAPPVAPAAAPKPQGLAIGLGIAVALLSGIAYGFLAKAIDREIGWAVIGIAAAVTATLGRLGGRGQALPAVAAVLSVLGLFFGQVFSIALFVHQELGLSVPELLTSQLDGTFTAWQHTREPIDALFYAIAVYFGFKYTAKFAS